MRLLPRLVLAGAVLAPVAVAAPAVALAQVQPHRAEYALRLGPALNAPRIGTAIHDLSQDCGGWHLKRDIKTEIAVTASWKMSLTSRLDGQEARSGNGFRYSAVQVQNGNEREVKGRVQRQGNDLRAEILPAGGTPNQFVLPPPTLMPVAAIDHLVQQLQARAASFPTLMFDAEVMGDAFLVDVTEQKPGQLRAARPIDKPVTNPSSTSWPVFMSFTRGRQQDQRPLFTVNALVFDNGVLDRLTIDTGLVTVTADLQSLEMRTVPSCPRS
jgi:hypothetical protein